MIETVEFKRLKLKSLKELNNAVRNYGPNAPFTQFMLETLSGGGYLIPGEWLRVTRAVLFPGQFLAWKADFLDHCQTRAGIYHRDLRAPEAMWTFDKPTRQGKYVSEERQLRLPAGLLAQVREAALGTWRAVPSKGALTMPLTKVIQGAQEPFSEFVARLQEVAEKVLGPGEENNSLLKQITYENANSACKSMLKGQTKNKTLHELVKLSSYVDMFSHKVSQSINLAIWCSSPGG